MELPIKDRATAGRYLANALIHYRNHENLLVLAIPRGGVPVAWEIALTLHASLDVIIVRKLGCPQQPELAFGAIADSDKIYLNQDIINQLCIDKETIDSVIRTEQTELQHRDTLYRGNKPRQTLNQKTIILVDDGLATGATMTVAVQAIKEHHPTSIVIAVPVAAVEPINELRKLVEHVICLKTPEPFQSVGQHYINFDQVSDQEVRDLLNHHSG